MSSRIRNDQRPKLNVLLVEDDPFQRIAIFDILGILGFQTTECENGIQARDELLKTENDFDVILLDLMMPEMSGIELLKIIKTIDRIKDIPVYVMSSKNENDVVASCLQAKAQDYIVKPVGYKKLYELKEKFINQQQPKKYTGDEKPCFSHVKNIGRGAAGSVELVRRSTDNELFAMKVIPMHFMKPEDKENAKNEIYLLKVLVGPTIINYYESFEENESINIIMEYAEGGSLYDRIQEQKNIGQQIDKDQILYWMAQMVIAVHCMHNRNVLHRDIKTQNMFLKKNIIKLGDFGISKNLGADKDFAKTFLGTPYFMPPEIIKGEEYGHKADIWALGCALYECIMFKRPFQGDNMQMVFDLIRNSPYDPIKESTDKDLAILVEKMLQKDPAKRPSIWELAKIPCIEEKINQFYKEHPQEKNLMQVVVEQNNNEELKSQENTQKGSIDLNIDEVCHRYRETAKFTRVTQGTLTQRHIMAFPGKEFFQWLQQQYTWKDEDQIRDYIQHMIQVKILQPVLTTQIQHEFQNSLTALYTFSRDLPNVPANMPKVFIGEDVDAFQVIKQGLIDAKRIQGLLAQNNQYTFHDLIQFESTIVQLQHTSYTESEDQNQKLSLFLNLYQLMRFHLLTYKSFIYNIRNLLQFTKQSQKICRTEQSQPIVNRLVHFFLPFLQKEENQVFSYQCFGHLLSLNEIKHGILRQNKCDPFGKFSRWDNADKRMKFVIFLYSINIKALQTLDPKVIFLFTEDQFKIQPPCKDKLQWPLNIFLPSTVQIQLEEIVNQWVSLNICLDTIEKEIVIQNLVQVYLPDFGGTQENVLKWLFKYMNVKKQEQTSILTELKENSFFVSFQDPNKSV